MTARLSLAIKPAVKLLKALWGIRDFLLQGKSEEIPKNLAVFLGLCGPENETFFFFPNYLAIELGFPSFPDLMSRDGNLLSAE